MSIATYLLEIRTARGAYFAPATFAHYHRAVRAAERVAFRSPETRITVSVLERGFAVHVLSKGAEF